jgi:Holliday junction resolvase RusA-like endonuclease
MIDRAADLRFTIFGIPQGQGAHRTNRAGYTYETNKNLTPWRQNAIYCAKKARDHDLPGHVFHSGIRVRAKFIYSRPASHYGTGRNAGVLKPKAPLYKESSPDLDHLQRAVGDALTQSGILRDDSRIVEWEAAKLWGDDDRTEISIWNMIYQFDYQDGNAQLFEEQPLLTS